MKLKNLIIGSTTALTLIGSTAIVVSVADALARGKNGTKISSFENLINVMGVPHDYNDSAYESRIAPFSDLGSWHGFSLPSYEDRNYWGGFTQPLLVLKTAPRSISKSLDQMHLYEYQLDSNGNIKQDNSGYKLKDEINFRALSTDQVHIKQYPGGLWQEFELDDLTLQLDLRFTHQRTSTVKYHLINHSKSKREFMMTWNGEVFSGAKEEIGATFEEVATINSHPYVTNEFGQPLLFNQGDTKNGEIIYVYQDQNKQWQRLSKDEGEAFNYAREGYVNGKKVTLATPKLLSDQTFQTFLEQEKLAFINRYKQDDQANLLAPENTINNAVSLKFTNFNETDNWLGHLDDWRYQINFPTKMDIKVNNQNGSYVANMEEPIVVESKKTSDLYVSTTFSFTSQEREGFQYENHLDVPGDYIKGSYYEEVKPEMANPQLQVLAFEQARKRWDYYLNNLIGQDKQSNFEFQKVAVKGMESLVTNWRGASGMLEHQGVTPSMSIQWFNSFWSWDTWKQASATTNFDPKLAMDNVKVMYDYQVVDDPGEDFHYHFDPVRRQNDIGMIPDLVDYQQGNTNWRDSKPPLSAWAVWNIYETVNTKMRDQVDFRTGEKLIDEVKEFLQYMYMRLMAYHAWWYQNRDGDGNGVVEYGATVDQQPDLPGWQSNDSEAKIVESAAWESGMDNAPRFDLNGAGLTDPGLSFIPNRNSQGAVSGYVLQQESVDLNSYMYAEKQYLIKIAKAMEKENIAYSSIPGIKDDQLKETLVKPMQEGLANRLKNSAAEMKIMGDIGKSYEKDIAQLEKDGRYLKDYINNRMFDQDSHFYYDLRYEVDINNNRLLAQDHLLVNRGKGIEGLIPLWANVPSKNQAQQVEKIVMDPHGFNTYLPLPTVAWDNDKFEPDQYWRGPVWLDQAYFALQGLSNYHYDDDASYLVNKLFANAEGLMSGGPIRETYNPITGKGNDAKGFSWSSGMYLLMYENYFKAS